MNATQRPPHGSLPDAEAVNDLVAEPPPPSMRTVSSRVLFNGANEVAIEHGGNVYRLKITRQNKLILNK